MLYINTSVNENHVCVEYIEAASGERILVLKDPFELAKYVLTAKLMRCASKPYQRRGVCCQTRRTDGTFLLAQAVPVHHRLCEAHGPWVPQCAVGEDDGRLE